MKTLNFFAEEDRLSKLSKLSKLGDQLEKLNSVMNWGIFESSLKGVFAKAPCVRLCLYHVANVHYCGFVIDSDEKNEYRKRPRTDCYLFQGSCIFGPDFWPFGRVDPADGFSFDRKPDLHAQRNLTLYKFL